MDMFESAANHSTILPFRSEIMNPHPDLTPLRHIRNIEFCSQDLQPLLPGKKLKLASTPLNAYAAVLQQEADSDVRSPDFCLFSLWIAAIASGERQDGGHEGKPDAMVQKTLTMRIPAKDQLKK
ncbi:hypothetical protein C8Q80DRAFT_1161966 [Daedaleopsis nitida]|nr:hypothetical protein C8Q80DRAFT_1161966 [Daedaleopsis nitida]